MSDLCTATTFPSSPSGFASLGHAAHRSPIANAAEEALSQTLEVVARCARIAWWDGSAIGLRLNGFMGLFGAVDMDVEDERRETLR